MHADTPVKDIFFLFKPLLLLHHAESSQISPRWCAGTDEKPPAHLCNSASHQPTARAYKYKCSCMNPDTMKAAATPSERRLRFNAGAWLGSLIRRPSYTGSYTKKRSVFPAVCTPRTVLSEHSFSMYSQRCHRGTSHTQVVARLPPSLYLLPFFKLCAHPIEANAQHNASTAESGTLPYPLAHQVPAPRPEV